MKSDTEKKAKKAIDIMKKDNVNHISAAESVGIPANKISKYAKKNNISSYKLIKQQQTIKSREVPLATFDYL